MTDMPPDSSPLQPRSSDNGTDPGEVALRALADRASPDAPTGPAGALADQVLVHTSWDAGQKLLDVVLSSNAGGFALRGSRASNGVQLLKREGFDGVLLIDSESYDEATATADAPFVLPKDTLYQVTLDEVLDGQRACGANVALTPTGYFRAGDSDALKAAADAVAALGRDDVLFSVPIDIAWLGNDHIGQLIAVLARLATPKAVFLGGQFDPLDRYKAAVANLRRLVAEAGHIAVLRTDLNGFDVLCHGAFATSIGTGGSLRHITPFGEPPRSSNNNDRSPSVLYPDLMAFFRGSTLAKRFANARSPRCPACGDRSLDTFLGKKDSLAAHAHGVHTWSEWITDMVGQPTLVDRAIWWRNRCSGALAEYDAVNAHLDQPDGFEAPKALKAWAKLPAWPSPTEPASRRSRTH
jgi:hypothetical protein